jgi:hypothetical protein
MPVTLRSITTVSRESATQSSKMIKPQMDRMNADQELIITQLQKVRRSLDR